MFKAENANLLYKQTEMCTKAQTSKEILSIERKNGRVIQYENSTEPV